MGGILDKLNEWLRGLLIEGITGNLSGMFDTVNDKVSEIAGEVGQTPLFHDPQSFRIGHCPDSRGYPDFRYVL